MTDLEKSEQAEKRGERKFLGICWDFELVICILLILIVACLCRISSLNKIPHFQQPGATPLVVAPPIRQATNDGGAGSLVSNAPSSALSTNE